MLGIILLCLIISLAIAGVAAFVTRSRPDRKRWFWGVWSISFLILFVLTILFMTPMSVQKS